MSDYQQEFMYKWEHRHLPKWVNTVLMSPEFCDRFMRIVCMDLGIDPPGLHTPNEELPSSWACNNEIVLSLYGRNNVTILHELSHIIMNRIHENVLDIPGGPHGPAFAGVYCVLLSKYGVRGQHLNPDTIACSMRCEGRLDCDISACSEHLLQSVRRFQHGPLANAGLSLYPFKSYSRMPRMLDGTWLDVEPTIDKLFKAGPGLDKPE